MQNDKLNLKYMQYSKQNKTNDQSCRKKLMASSILKWREYNILFFFCCIILVLSTKLVKDDDA
jgi:hypothetical protein